MTSPRHMTMKELLALPVIAHVEELVAGTGATSSIYGGAFTDDDGYLWRTVQVDGGWARCPACLIILADARNRSSHTSLRAVTMAAGPRPRRGVLDAVLRAFG